MTESNESLFVLTGCTAVGKTEWALEWAESNDAEIVSCDSLLFYKGMDIGTAKPTGAERARVPHHLIDICEPHERMDIAAFLPLAIAAVEDIRVRGKKVLVTGGSGFYLKAFFSPVLDSVRVSTKTRETVRSLEQAGGLEKMVEILRSLDPDCEGELDIQNPRRVLKALERCMETGKSMRQLKTEFSSQKNPLTEMSKKLVVLDRDRKELDARIEERVAAMLKEGLVEEVKRLRADGFESNPSGAGSIGYRETLAYLDGEIEFENLARNIVVDTQRLAKKQRTWFRTQLPVSKTINLTKSTHLGIIPLFR